MLLRDMFLSWQWIIESTSMWNCIKIWSVVLSYSKFSYLKRHEIAQHQLLSICGSLLTSFVQMYLKMTKLCVLFQTRQAPPMTSGCGVPVPVIWPVKIVPDMAYNVFGFMLNLAQSSHLFLSVPSVVFSGALLLACKDTACWWQEGGAVHRLVIVFLWDAFNPTVVLGFGFRLWLAYFSSMAPWTWQSRCSSPVGSDLESSRGSSLAVSSAWRSNAKKRRVLLVQTTEFVIFRYNWTKLGAKVFILL